MPDVSRHGSWPSPITSELVVASAVRLDQVWVDGEHLWWGELRPEEQGRVVVVRRTPGTDEVDVLPDGYSARTRVHEYGGGAWWLHDGALYFVNWTDQRLYRFDPAVDTEPHALTPEPESPAALRYADGRVTPDHRWIVCVRERHPEGVEAVNEIVAVPVDGGDPIVLVGGADFVSFPRPSPDGRWLAWTQWDHPAMPWDETSLWVGELVERDGAVEVVAPTCVAGADGGESIYQPEWSPDGRLHFVSDRTDWWNLYAFAEPGRPAGDPVPLAPLEGEVGLPQWVFGESRYAFLDGGRVLLAYAADGVDHLALLDGTGLHPLSTDYTSFSSVRAYGEGAALIAASPVAEPAVVVLEPGDEALDAPTFAVVRPPRDLGLAPDDVSRPEPIEFPTDGGRARALFYRPANPAVTAPSGERPPLIVSIHGGPTSAARPILNLSTQFWTSRGFAVVDVNYRGSTGYGRSFRGELAGAWGVADVDDCIAAVRYLVERGEVDSDRLVIHGGSAGGFTTLCVLERSDAFAAGASYYGVVDLEALARDTHKFESRYLDSIVGPYPQDREVYVERSPIHHTDRLTSALIIFQGLDDEVVPPSQADVLVEALRAKGVPMAYVPFEGEEHGFRRAPNIRAALEAELSFYAQVLDLGDPPGIEPVAVENLPRSTGGANL